jgi:putative MATE family efflux protein
MTCHTPHPRPRLLSITWPIFSEHLLHASVGMLFVWLTAQISDSTAAAFGLSNQIMTFFIILFRLVGVGASVVITQYLGGGDREGAERIARASLAAGLLLGVISAAVIWLGADSLLALLKLPEDLRPEAKPYLLLLGAALIFDSLNATMASVLRANTFTRDTLLLIVAMYISSLVIGLPFMYGWFGFPNLGLVGIGIGFVASRAIAQVLYLWLWRRRLGIRPHIEDWWKIRIESLREMMHIGLPGAGENIAYRLSFTANLAIVAGFGATALATHTYILQISYFVLLCGLAIGFGTEIVVGHLIGAGQLHDANRLVRKSLRFGIAGAFCVAGIVALCGKSILGAFSSDPQVILGGAKILLILVLLEPGRTFNLVVINALRATGDARFPVMFGVFSMFFVSVGLAWLLGVHFGLGLIGVWLGFASDEWVRGIAMYVRWQRKAWVPHARKTRRRIIKQRVETFPEPAEAT